MQRVIEFGWCFINLKSERVDENDAMLNDTTLRLRIPIVLQPVKRRFFWIAMFSILLWHAGKLYTMRIQFGLSFDFLKSKGLLTKMKNHETRNS